MNRTRSIPGRLTTTGAMTASANPPERALGCGAASFHGSGGGAAVAGTLAVSNRATAALAILRMAIRQLESTRWGRHRGPLKSPLPSRD